MPALKHSPFWQVLQDIPYCCMSIAYSFSFCFWASIRFWSLLTLLFWSKIILKLNRIICSIFISFEYVFKHSVKKHNTRHHYHTNDTNNNQCSKEFQNCENQFCHHIREILMGFPITIIETVDISLFVRFSDYVFNLV